MRESDPGLIVCHYSVYVVVSLIAATSDERCVLWYTAAMPVLLSGFVVLPAECV